MFLSGLILSFQSICMVLPLNYVVFLLNKSGGNNTFTHLYAFPFLFE